MKDVFNFPITKKNKILYLSPEESEIGTQFDNDVQEFVFSRPEGFDGFGLWLVFSDGQQTYAPYDIGQGNSFILPSELTKTARLFMQAFFKNGGEEERTNKIKITFRQSLPQSAAPPPPLWKQLAQKAFTYAEKTAAGVIEFFNLAGEKIVEIETGGGVTKAYVDEMDAETLAAAAAALEAHNESEAAHADIRESIADETADRNQAIENHNTDEEAHGDIRSAIPTETEIEGMAGAAVSAHNEAEDSHADIREQIIGLSTLGGGWLGQNFPTFADLEAFEQNRPAGFETIPDKTWARVFDDENHADALTVYAWFNNTLAYQYTMVIDPRNFSTDPIQTNEIADAAVTNAKIADATISGSKLQNYTITGGPGGKIADRTIQFGQMADLSNMLVDTDTAPFAAYTSGTFSYIFQRIASKINGLFSRINAIPAGRDFTANPIQTAEIAASAVTDAKIADNTISKYKHANITYYGLVADTTDFSGSSVSNTLPNFVQILAEKIKGLHSVVVKITGNQTIAGTKTFSTTPVIPSATTIPATPSATKPATEAQLGALSSEMTAALNNKVSKTTETNKLYGTGPSGQPVLYPTEQFHGLDDFRFCGESYLSTDPETGEKFVDVKLIPVFSVLANNTIAILMAGGAYFNQQAFKAYWAAENGALLGAGWSPTLSGGDTVWSMSDRPTGAVGIQIIDSLHGNKLMYRTAISKSNEDVIAAAAVRKTGTVNVSVWGSGTVNDEQGRTWEPNTYNALIVKGSVLGNGSSGTGSRIELDLNIQFNLWCTTNLAAGAEIVFQSVPINMLWNINSLLGVGSVGTEWIADSSAVFSLTGNAWAFPTPMQIEENGKQIIGAKVCCNMTAAVAAASGGTTTPGQLYVYGGMRALADLSYPTFFFNGRMRAGFTRA
ncbi:MAG: hypothetical protein LBD07_02535 [Spirochaetaceae bacterium]|jgi:hypothetical protein|nr:hypothetical protein [Spirochaetaceae bacterium]